MKTLYISLFALLLVIHGRAQDRSNHTQRSRGLEMIGGSRNDYSQYRSLNRFNYWTSRYDRYWSKWEKFASKDFIRKISRSTRNLSRISNGWNVAQYSTKDSERQRGLIKIN